jgi:hypothetical protein
VLAGAPSHPALRRARACLEGLSRAPRRPTPHAPCPFSRNPPAPPLDAQGRPHCRSYEGDLLRRLVCYYQWRVCGSLMDRQVCMHRAVFTGQRGSFPSEPRRPAAPPPPQAHTERRPATTTHGARSRRQVDVDGARREGHLRTGRAGEGAGRRRGAPRASGPRARAHGAIRCGRAWASPAAPQGRPAGRDASGRRDACRLACGWWPSLPATSLGPRLLAGGDEVRVLRRKGQERVVVLGGRGGHTEGWWGWGWGGGEKAEHGASKAGRACVCTPGQREGASGRPPRTLMEGALVMDPTDAYASLAALDGCVGGEVWNCSGCARSKTRALARIRQAFGSGGTQATGKRYSHGALSPPPPGCRSPARPSAGGTPPLI